MERAKASAVRSPNRSPHRRYERMVLETETAPFVDNALAQAFSWLLLAGYLVFPGTFTSLRDSSMFRAVAAENAVGHAVYRGVQNTPLLGLAGISCAVGATGAGWLWYRWQHNYVWITRQLFLPTLVNATTGFANTLINIYTARHGTWSVTAIITAAVTGTFAGISALLFLLYSGRLHQMKKGIDPKKRNRLSTDAATPNDVLVHDVTRELGCAYDWQTGVVFLFSGAKLSRLQ
ncbi:hypothetical protein ZTR_10498 [Talaromyces verruculosus]|nr:hypothetical protein ZTR_10498 [Talaromyces verruculosus]